jgi:L-rhamnose isomerase/sugar isomerase
MVGAADPFQLFRIMHEVVSGGALDPAAGVAFMLDQCHNIEPKIPAQIRSVMNVQEATAKALLIDADALAAAQRAGDVLGANAVFMDAYNTDVRPLLAEVRAEMGLDPDPIAAYHRSGYAGKIIAERVGGTPAGWGS